MMIAIRTPVTMMAKKDKKDNDFQKRAQKDTKKISKAFDKVFKGGDKRREDIGKNLQSFVDDIDKLAKKDVKKIQEIFADDTDIEETIDLEDDGETTSGDVIIFK